MNSQRISSIRPKKSLGQNFLRDENISRKIISAFHPQATDFVLEIGPGEGALTKYLAPSVNTLLLVDLDDAIIRLMRDTYANQNVAVFHQDFLTFDLVGAAAQMNSSFRVIGNIPYNITSPILFHLLDNRSVVRDATLMIQKEVADRLVALPDTKEYGIPSVFFQLFAGVEKLFDVSPNAFYPKPGVTSTVVRITMREQPLYEVKDEAFFREMVRAVFSKRRKTLRNSLKYFREGIPEEVIEVDLQMRPEDLTVRELVAMNNSILTALSKEK